MPLIDKRQKEPRERVYFLAMLLIICEIITCMVSIPVTVVFAGTGIGMLTIYKGILICTDAGRIKEYFSLVGYKIGDW